MDELQRIFHALPTYGKFINMDGYSTSDAIKVLQIYFETLTQPLVPTRSFYRAFELVFKGEKPRKQQITAKKMVEYYQILIRDVLSHFSAALFCYMLSFLKVMESSVLDNRAGGMYRVGIDWVGFFQVLVRNHPKDLMDASMDSPRNILEFLLEHPGIFENVFSIHKEHAGLGIVTMASESKYMQGPRRPQTPDNRAELFSTG